MNPEQGLVMTPDVMPAVSGTPVVLWCSGNFSGNVTYEFLKDSSHVVQSGSSDMLELPSADVTDSGVYRCDVTLDSGGKYDNGVVTVTIVGK